MSTTRALTARDFPVTDANGVKGCRWCRGPIPKYRRTLCSDACVHEISLRTSPGYVRQQVEARDRGVCAACGFPAGAVHDLLRRARRRSWKWWKALAEQFARAGAMSGYGYSDGHTWEADHIIPVSEGGGLCGLENYRTLCLRCHKKETAALKRRLADKRMETR